MPAAPFELLDLAGDSVALSDLEGQVVVLAFWATWCEPCIQELGELQTAYARYANSDQVAIVAISVDSNKADVAPFVERRAYSFRVLLADGAIEAAYGTRAIPQLYVLDAAGKIRFHQAGFHFRDFQENLDWMIAAASTPRASRE